LQGLWSDIDIVTLHSLKSNIYKMWRLSFIV